jgi:hypothetical protein
VRAEITPLAKLKVDVAMRGACGPSGASTATVRGSRRCRATISSPTFRYATPLGTLTGFAYLVDQDEAAVQKLRLSSQTYGARLSGAVLGRGQAGLSGELCAPVGLSSQSERLRRGLLSRRSLLDADGPKLGGGYEVLGADKGVALTSFQTPLATGFKFQGWADKFLTTPPNGVRDLMAASVTAGRRSGPLKARLVQAVYHRFDSDRLSQHYGNEIDLLRARSSAAPRFRRATPITARTALRPIRARLWLQLDWAL